MNDEQRGWLDDRVQELIAVESRLGSQVRTATERSAPPALVDIRSRLAALADEHRDALVICLGDRRVVASAAGGAAEPAARTLPEMFAVLSHAVMSYAALFEAALRLYDEPLRALAPKHQTDYSTAMHAVADLLAASVAAELCERGWECQCVCPMCSIGLCGCVAVGRMAAVMALRARDPEPAAGFEIQQPRAGSQLAALDVAGGDRLIAIDGRPADDVAHIQAAIRSHDIGQAMQLTVMHRGERRELTVTHVGDYPG
jgi:hypothetical protein